MISENQQRQVFAQSMAYVNQDFLDAEIEFEQAIVRVYQEGGA